MGVPYNGGALGPDAWYPPIPGSPEEKDLGSLFQPRKGGGGGISTEYCSSLSKSSSIESSRGRFST